MWSEAKARPSRNHVGPARCVAAFEAVGEEWGLVLHRSAVAGGGGVAIAVERSRHAALVRRRAWAVETTVDHRAGGARCMGRRRAAVHSEVAKVCVCHRNLVGGLVEATGVARALQVAAA